MATVDLRGLNGIRLAAEVLGPEDGPPVVLSHGGGQTRHAWGTTLQVLADQGWRAYSVDARGHGDSDWAPDGDYTMDAFSGDIRAIALGLEQPPALVGASLGGLSAMVAISEHDGSGRDRLARALVLVDVGPRMEEAGRNRIGDFMREHLEGFASLDEVADAIAAYNPHRPRPTDLSGLQKNVRQRPDGRWYWHWDPRFIVGPKGSTDETRSALVEPGRLEDAARKLTVPTLLVRGRVSDLLSEEGARQMLELAPHTEYVDVAGAGHMVAGDRNDAFNDAVVSFLSALPPTE